MLLTLLLASLASLHPDSLSTSTVTITDAGARLDVRCGVLSLMQVVDGLDGDGDGDVSVEELAAREEEVLGYVGAHYELFVDANAKFEQGIALAPSGGAAVAIESDAALAMGFRRGQIGVSLDFEYAATIENLSARVTLFHDVIPLHIDYSSLVQGDTRSNVHVLEVGHEWARLSERGRGTFSVFFPTGFRHILSGWDHIAFVAALVLASRRLRSLLAVVTAFTVAHSVTLGLSVLGIVDVSMYAREIEAAVALSIAYVAIDCLVHSKVKRSRWVESLLFGLVHGLAFAGFLSASLLQSSDRATALFGFNLGVEAGQILVVLALALGLRLFPRSASEEDPFLAPRLVQKSGLVAVAALGFWWFFQRV